jgi:hypothetical protein
MMDEKTTDSVFAIKQYIAKNKSNADRHEANVLVHAERKDFGWGKRFVSATVNQDIGQVIIEDLFTIYGSCTNIFTTQNAIFTYCAGTLRIKAKNAVGVDISINIT